MAIINRLLDSVVFWAAWIIIPVIMEIAPSVASVFLLLKRHWRKRKNYKKPKVYPEISLIIPVYNSEATLFGCIKSIYDCDYPNDKIRVFLVNNKGKDNSFAVYQKCQEEIPDLHMQWLNAQQGKSKALNLALYNSQGKYIINLDSDGMLQKNALTNMVDKFEANPELNCMTGAILTTPEMIEEFKGFFPKLLRKLEFMEYAQAFLAGRSYASETNGVYTLSGAFSAFRKSAVLKSQMYNTDTICEDTHITFQMKNFYGERVEVCEDAIYMVDPIEGINKLYTQRQRWQRGSLEVAKMFSAKNFSLRNFFKDINIKTLAYDHTFAFPRMIWYLALIVLLCMNYSSKAILVSTGVIFVLYIVIGFFYFASNQYFLKSMPELRRYYCKQWWIVLLLPAFNLLTFFIRFAGIVNSINTDSAWRTRDFNDERNAFVEVIREDVKDVINAADKLKGYVNGAEKKKEPKENFYGRQSIGWYVCVGVVYLLSVLAITVVGWVNSTYGVGFNEIVNFIKYTPEGAGTDVVLSALKNCVPTVIIASAAVALLIFLDRRSCSDTWVKVKGIVQKVISVGAVIIFFGAIFYINKSFEVVDYYKTRVAQTKLYDEYYVMPDSVKIKAPAKKKNLIYIYIESLETTYASSEDGGAQSDNYIPNLTKLANDNISFSDSDKLGGFHSTQGTGDTMEALFGTTSGTPYSLDTQANQMLEQGSFMTGITSLGDILLENGYTQEFLCGSDSDLAGKKTYFETHGNYYVFDLYTAREKDYIADDYFVWWGYEDRILYEIAKDEVLRLAAEDEPFNFTMLTADSHHIDGYVCKECDKEYENVTANVMKCADTLLGNFIEWCKKQDFYDDTVIIISGDHPRMDNSLVAGVGNYDRTVYNCFINTGKTNLVELTDNRIFTPMDMFPTTLSALGFEIEGDRLALGTDLFSDTPTLAEEKGFEWLDAEISKTSLFYYDVFVPELER